MRIRESVTKDEKIVVVCAWCPDNIGLTAEYKKSGYEVSHGICVKCSKEFDPNADKQVVNGFGEKPL